MAKFSFRKIKKTSTLVGRFTHTPRVEQVYPPVGFIKEGIKRECIKGGNNFRSLIIMSILHQDFKSFKLPFKLLS